MTFDNTTMVTPSRPEGPLEVILGLDISTAIIGYAYTDANTGEFISCGHIDLRKIKSLWEKTDYVQLCLARLSDKTVFDIKRLFIEENLQRYRSGMSSAKTISLLAKFNGLVSYLARLATNCEPEFLASTSARKLCGIKIVRDDPRDAKRQTFDWVTDRLQADWPKTRAGNAQQYCYDQADAYVIALAGWIQSQDDE